MSVNGREAVRSPAFRPRVRISVTNGSTQMTELQSLTFVWDQYEGAYGSLATLNRIRFNFTTLATVGDPSSLRDRFWPRSALSMLLLATVLTLASVQFVSPTRRWRPRLPGRARPVPGDAPDA